MSEREWYASKEHFNTELSYEGYLKRRKKNRKKRNKNMWEMLP